MKVIHYTPAVSNPSYLFINTLLDDKAVDD